MPEGRWILMDYLDCVVHIFTPDAREYYRLDRLWGEVPQLELELARFRPGGELVFVSHGWEPDTNGEGRDR